LTNVDLRHDDLVELVGKSLSIEECVDRITFMGAGPEGVQGDVMTFDVFPNRPDLYSVEGIARGLRGFLDLEVGLPVYHLESSGIEFVVDHSVADVRPFAVGGIVRGLELEDALLRSLVDLQEKLHLSASRRSAWPRSWTSGRFSRTTRRAGNTPTWSPRSRDSRSSRTRAVGS